MAKETETGKTKKTSFAAVLAWILAGLLLVSVFLNLITMLSIQGFRKTLGQMHEPVYVYFTQELNSIEADLQTLSTATGGDKSPFVKDERKLEKAIGHARSLWEQTREREGEAWFNTYVRAKRAEDEVDKLWKDYRKKLGLQTVQ
jgi:hypothetical protein